MFRLLALISLLTAAGVAWAATAVPVSPQRISVAAGESQVFSARFFNSQGQPSVGENVRFFNDACGTVNGGGFFGDSLTDSSGLASVRFTALNTGFIACTMTASGASGATVSYSVTTYRPASVTVNTTLSPPEPRPGQAFDVIVSPSVGVFDLYGVDVTARVVAGTAGASLPAGSVLNTGQDGSVRFRVQPDGRIGNYDLELDFRGRIGRVSMMAPPNPWQDLWWSGAAENGWGMSVVQHRDMLFTIVYAYDDAGKPIWYVMPSGEWNAARTAFSGDVFLPHGTPYSNYDASRFDIGAKLGRLTITFNGANDATLDYTIAGMSGRKSITRILFGQGSAAAMPGLGDMWWGGPAQNGWGFSLLQQGRDLFTLWFTYDEAGAATWFVMPAGGWIDSRTVTGGLYRSAGSPWLGRTYDASQFRMNDVGSYSLHFNEDGTASFHYAMGGASATLPLSRIPF